MIPYGRQEITAADLEAVAEVLRSDFLTQGPVVPMFEEQLAAYCGASHAVASSNATASLYLACRALGLGPNDRLWTSPNTFVASANVALLCGAEVDFVDIDPATYNMSVEALASKLEQAKRESRLPKIVLPVHFAGQSCDMQAIAELAQHYGFRIVEDASHAIGGSYLNAKVGNCRFSDVAVFSFHPVKIITTGEGGIATTNDSELAYRMALLRSHGITRDDSRMQGDSEGPWYYQQLDIGFNFRLTEIQAALGLSQLKRLDAYVARRHEIAQQYDRRLASLPIIKPYQCPKARSSYHLYPIQVEANRSRIFKQLREAGIGVNVHYIPVPAQPYYQHLGFRASDCPNAVKYYEHAISLPMFPTLTEEQQEKVCRCLEVALQ